jgi:two-component system response regulator GlrR
MLHPLPEPERAEALEAIAGTSDLMRTVRSLTAVAASRADDTLIVGEPGTGKELIARTIHALAGAKGPFVCVDASAPAGELDGKLFGEKPAGTTIYLREIGQLAPSLQPHLRRALEQRDSGGTRTPLSNVRLVCASTRDLASAAKKGGFDEALSRRLSTFVIQVPPLRSRKEDIPLLVDYLLGTLKNEVGHQVESFSPAAIDILAGRDWPGNVRELFDQIRTTVILSPARVIEPADLEGDAPDAEPWDQGYRELRKRVLLRFESDFVARILKAAGGNVSMAARLAKIDRKHLWRLIQRTGMKLDRLEK